VGFQPTGAAAIDEALGRPGAMRRLPNPPHPLPRRADQGLRGGGALRLRAPDVSRGLASFDDSQHP